MNGKKLICFLFFVNVAIDWVFLDAFTYTWIGLLQIVKMIIWRSLLFSIRFFIILWSKLFFITIILFVSLYTRITIIFYTIKKSF